MLLCSRQCHAPNKQTWQTQWNIARLLCLTLPSHINSPYKFKDSTCNKSNNPVYLSSPFQIFFIVLNNCIRLPYSGLLTRLFSSSYKNTIIHLEFKKTRIQAQQFPREVCWYVDLQPVLTFFIFSPRGMSKPRKITFRQNTEFRPSSPHRL